MSVLLVQTQFVTSKYKKKIPIPNDNTHVTVEGFLHMIEMGKRN